MYNILICDDEKDIVNALKIYLNDSEYQFFEAYNGKKALEIMEKEEIHLVLLDIMMPVMDGIETLNKIRGFSNVPVIFLTAKSEEVDMILGLNLGADDYITKPFRPMEVTARVKSHLRRYLQLGAGEMKADVLRIQGLELNDKAKQVMVDGEIISLTPTEYEILKLLMEHPGQVFSPNEFYEKLTASKSLPRTSQISIFRYEEEFENRLTSTTVTFDANGGEITEEDATMTVYYGQNYGVLPTPQRQYHSFLGWYTAAEGGTQITEESVGSRLYQAVTCVENAGLIIETPENLWDLSEKKEYGENVILYLQNRIKESEFRKRLSWM